MWRLFLIDNSKGYELKAILHIVQEKMLFIELRQILVYLWELKKEKLNP